MFLKVSIPSVRTHYLIYITDSKICLRFMQDIWNLQVAHFHVQFFLQFKLGSFFQESLFMLNKFCGLHSIFGRCEISFQKPLCKGVFCPFRPFLHVSFRSILVPFRTNSVLFKSSTVGIADSAKTRLSAL